MGLVEVGFDKLNQPHPALLKRYKKGHKLCPFLLNSDRYNELAIVQNNVGGWVRRPTTANR